MGLWSVPRTPWRIGFIGITIWPIKQQQALTCGDRMNFGWLGVPSSMHSIFTGSCMLPYNWCSLRHPELRCKHSSCPNRSLLSICSRTQCFRCLQHGAYRPSWWRGMAVSTRNRYTIGGLNGGLEWWEAINHWSTLQGYNCFFQSSHRLPGSMVLSQAMVLQRGGGTSFCTSQSGPSVQAFLAPISELPAWKPGHTATEGRTNTFFGCIEMGGKLQISLDCTDDRKGGFRDFHPTRKASQFDQWLGCYPSRKDRLSAMEEESWGRASAPRFPHKVIKC